MGLLDCTPLVIVLLMTLCLTVTPSGGQTNNTLSSDGTIVWGKLAPDKPYQTATYQADDGGLDPYYNLARSFIDSSLPEYLPLEETKDLLDGKTSIGTAWQGLVMKFIGFIICLAIGFLFIIIFPIVCCCFCCCRCCGNCGGKRLQKKDKRANCKRTVFSVCLFVLSAFVITGAACVFVTSDQFHKNLNGLNQSVNESASDIDTFIENLQSQFNRIGDENFKFLAGVLNTYVTGASSDVSERLIDKISSAVSLDQPLNTLSNLSTKAGQTTTQLSDKVATLKTQRDDAVDTIQSDCPSACTAEINSLNATDIATLQTKVKSFKDQVSTDVFGAMKRDIDVKIKTEIENATKAINVTSQLDGIYNDQIKPLLSKIDDLQKSANDMASSMTSKVKDGVKLVEQYDIYRWYAGIGLASLILLMALFALTGLLLGCFCGSAKAKPTERSSASNCGGICLMSSVGFIFIFGAFLMLLCTLMYVFGSMTERYGCQTFKDLSKVEKYTSSLNLGLNLHNISFTVMNSTISLGASRLMDGCKQGQTLYSVLGLSSIINSSLAKIEDYKKNLNISGNIDATKVASSVSGGVNVSNEVAQLQETVNATKDLKSAITNMKTAVVGIKTSLSTKSQGGPAKLDAMIATLTDMETITDTLTADSTNIVNEANKLPALINDATNKLSDAAFMTSLVSNVTQEFVDKIFSFVDSYISNIVSMMATDVGKCTPVYSISNAIFGEAICHGLIDPLNGFWLALGWSIFFLMPSLIFSVKLAKYFRRMLYDDSYDTKAPSAPPEYNELSMTQTSKQSVFPPLNGTNKVAPF